MVSNKPNTFLGLDLSTQQLKLIAVDKELCIIAEEVVNFDRDLPEFKTQDGVQRHADSLTVTAPTLMWVKALDLLMERMKSKGFPFVDVACISGTGQQHGSVYWKTGTKTRLNNLDPSKGLYEQLKESFAIDNSPIWMDSSTTAQCRALEQAVGGAQALAEITGSCAYERFTGNQIAKIHQTKPASYDECEHISLVSSFLASLFLGDYAPIDYSDGSGMNLMNIHTKTWESVCLQACAPNLEEKLGDLVPSSQGIGEISKYLCSRYGFHKSCEIVAFTGDNPASLAGVRLQKTDICISLGTSDTLMLWLNTPKPAVKGHIFVNPVDKNAYMALLCFKNGSLVRESVRDQCSDGSWEIFGQSLSRSPPGNSGNIGIYFHETEITPFAQGVYRFDKNDVEVQSFTNDEEIRALVEGQFLAKRVHAEDLGLTVDKDSRILATGGASQNQAILQVLSDIFHAPVFTIPGTANSACLGCAYRAKHGWSGTTDVKYDEIFPKNEQYDLAVTPRVENKDLYDVMAKRYKILEQCINNKSLSAESN
ncbi:xylulose kinase-like [Dendronephthya gigantea]|uniref:xylulose kinase-like n=1 Tax=Dendronephthya gigantea TaxID=151771 RepID=UPI00106946E2|nr:xylulose kinase-like [Dendronephthya gigantea]